MNFLKTSSAISIILSLTTTVAFTAHPNIIGPAVRVPTTQLQSFYADSSDYKSSDSDFSSEDDDQSEFGVPTGAEGDETESPSVEETPVPMSKNAGNRFLAFVFDRALTSVDKDNIDVLDLHEDRISLTEDHVMFCRKANLYNENFNSDSMADVLWSNQLLSSDLKRTVGHAICIESTTIEYAQELLSRDPIVQKLTGGDISNIPLYRWRQIRDYSLRVDDGRHGNPTLLIAMDRSPEEGIGNLREDVKDDYMEYLIRSERIISAGPLHLPTEFKDDPSSIAVGDFILFNSKDRDDAIEFAEKSPAAEAGLYGNMKLHGFNNLDVTGKFVATDVVDPQKTRHTEEMTEALEHWGYPVSDRETKWLNW